MINHSKESSHFLAKAVRRIALVFSVLWLFNALTSKNITAHPALAALVALIVILVGFVAKRKLKNFLLRLITAGIRYKWAIFIVMVVAQLILLLFTSTLAGYDVYAIFHMAVGDTTDLSYLKVYPNNFLIFLFMRALRSLTLLQLANIIAIDFSLVMTYIMAKRHMTQSVADRALLVFMATLGFTPWLLNTYSDTFVLPFVTLAMFCLFELRRRPRKFYFGLLAGFASAMAYFIKPSAIIFLIAFVLAFLFEKNSIKKWLALALSFVAIATGFVVTDAAYTAYKDHQNIVTFDKSVEFPMTHFLMMGISVNGPHLGAYNSADVSATSRTPGYAAKERMNLRVFWQRLRAMGPVGYTGFLLRKYWLNTQDGTYGWGYDGSGITGFMVAHNLNRSKMLAPFVQSSFGRFLRTFVYTNGEGPRLFVYQLIGQMVYLIMVAGILRSFVRGLGHDFYHVWLYLTLIGGMTFLLLFEGGRSRYLIQFLPSFVLLAGLGWGKEVSQELRQGLPLGHKVQKSEI